MNSPSSIKPIETVYKGYRFRSRLEARWAVFFDELGINWQYEAQGFDLRGDKYLPDFYIPKYKTFVEIKGENLRTQYHPPKVYMAGRMGENDYRDFDISYTQYNATSALPIFIDWNGLEIEYCGPFAIDEKAHTGEHGNGLRADVYARSIYGIDNCEIFFAYIGDHEAFGTLFEIGYATGRNKQVVLGFDEACNHNGHPETEVAELWFAAESTKLILSGNKKSIISQFSSWLKLHHSPPREFKLSSALAQASGEGVILCYGDPLETMEKGSYVFRSPGLIQALKRLPKEDIERAGLSARQSRFEHGQSGAR